MSVSVDAGQRAYRNGYKSTCVCVSDGARSGQFVPVKGRRILIDAPASHLNSIVILRTYI